MAKDKNYLNYDFDDFYDDEDKYSSSKKQRLLKKQSRKKNNEDFQDQYQQRGRNKKRYIRKTKSKSKDIEKQFRQGAAPDNIISSTKKEYKRYKDRYYGTDNTHGESKWHDKKELITRGRSKVKEDLKHFDEDKDDKLSSKKDLYTKSDDIY